MPINARLPASLFGPRIAMGGEICKSRRWIRWQAGSCASLPCHRLGRRASGPQLFGIATTCDDDLRRERPDQRNTGVVEHAVSMGATERPSLTNSSTAPRPIPLAPPLMIAILPPHLPMRFAVFGSTPRCYRSLSDTPFRSQRCGARCKVRPTMQAAAPPRHKRTRR
jgi:hypothetical protein